MLLNQSLRENIRFGSHGKSDFQVWKAVQAAMLDEMVGRLENGLDTEIGERGVRLSGGERQRVSCARCIMRAPSIMLFDEACSSMDSWTERKMLENVREECEGRTMMIVAHRLSSVRWADQIVVLGVDGVDDGLVTVVERGKHEELVELGGTYALMWQEQAAIL